MTKPAMQVSRRAALALGGCALLTRPALAQQAGDANFYEMSVIDGRLREMKRRQIEEMKERRN